MHRTQNNTKHWARNRLQWQVVYILWQDRTPVRERVWWGILARLLQQRLIPVDAVCIQPRYEELTINRLI